MKRPVHAIQKRKIWRIVLILSYLFTIILHALIPGLHKQFISKGLVAVSKRPPVVQLPLFWQGQISNCGCRNAIAPKLSMAMNVNVMFSNSVGFQVNVNKSPSCVKYPSTSSSPRETLKLLVSVTLNT